MGLALLVFQFVAVTAFLTAVAAVVVIGPRRLRLLPAELRQRVRIVTPHLLLLAVVLGLNRIARRIGPEVSWIIGMNITQSIHAVEGEFVAALQSLASPPLTTYFSFMYLYGYAFLVVFPVFAYIALDDSEPLREITLAYSLNYGFGVVAYVVFIAYGPRNFIPDLVDPLLYTAYPQSQLLTREVNVNTNVFPSLHSSLSITVALLAWETRDVYRRWLPIAWPTAASVVVATMYLGIHWGIDVVGGAAMAVASVTLARRWVGQVPRPVKRILAIREKLPRTR